MEIIARYRCGFYYEQLSIDQQFLYHMIAASVSSYKSYVDIDKDVDEKNIHRIKVAIQYDNPELFYWSLDNSEVTSGRMLLHYSTETKEEAKKRVNKIKKKRYKLLSEFSKNCSTQKEMFMRVYDYLVETVRYAEEEAQRPKCAQSLYDIQGPFLWEKGVCLGIAQTVNYYCIALHIPAILVTGRAKVDGWDRNHGWNLIKLDEQYYHVDVTSEICDRSQKKERKYFLKKDEDFIDRHWSKTIYPKTL